MKVPASGRAMGKLACTCGLTFDGLTRMNEQGNSPDHEYGWQLWECQRHGAADFHGW